MNDQITVTYFGGVNNRASVMRAILSYAKATFTNKAVSQEEWGPLKSSGAYEYGQMPGVEVNGKMHVQTVATEFYLGRKFGLVGDNQEDEYHILSLLCSREDLYAKSTSVMYLWVEENTKNLEANLKDFGENTLPGFLKCWENRVVAKKGKYILGDKFSLEDILMCVWLNNLIYNNYRQAALVPVLEKFPKLKSYIDSIAANELSEYFAKYHVKDAML